MAGGYQTNGETPRTGTGMNQNSGGGWVNGRGDSTMTMLKSFVYIVDFFTSFAWWKTEPQNEVILNYEKDFKAFCLSEPGKTYVFYLPVGGNVKVLLENATYAAKRLNPRTGEILELPQVNCPVWTSPDVPDNEDWVFFLYNK